MTRPRTGVLVALLLPFLLFLAHESRAAVPAAPSNLRLTEQSWNSFHFAWNDNASDEVAQPLYISEGGAPFYVIATYRANATSGALLHMNPGRLYRIYVTAKNASGESAPSNTLDVFIPKPDLKAQFAWLPLRPTVDDDITFYDGSFGSPIRWRWDFGDGTTSTQRNPLKRYAAPGEYAVSLTVGSSSAESSLTKVVTVTGGGGATEPLIAGFDCGLCTAVTGDDIEFRDTSTGGAAAWNWSFGDGASSTERNPRHAFAIAGSYAVTLTVSRGTTSAAHSRTVTVAEKPAPRLLLIPAAARIGGAAGSAWRTSLTLTNAATIPADLTLTLLPPAGASGASRTVSIPHSATQTYDDVIFDLFGLAEGSGAILIEPAAGAELDAITAQSRTFTAATGGTMGQFIPALRIPRDAGRAILPGIEANDAYRTNVGFANGGNQPAHVTLTLLGGSVPLHASVDIAPRSFAQQPLPALFASIDAAAEVLTLTIESNSADVAAYASVVDNTTNDPTYIAASAAPADASLVAPVIGRTPGAEGTFWRTDLALFNPASTASTLRLRVPGTAMQKDVTLEPGELRQVRDVALFLGSETMTGALEIEAAGAAPVVTARTYTTLAAGGTLGQSIDVVASDAAAATARIFGIRHDAGVRANVGFVERSGTANDLLLELRSDSGVVLAAATVALSPWASVQMRVTELFPAFDFTKVSGSMVLDARSSGGRPFFAWASLVDNASGDPLFILGR